MLNKIDIIPRVDENTSQQDFYRIIRETQDLLVAVNNAYADLERRLDALERK